MIHRTLSTSSMLTLDQIDLADIDFFVHGDMYEAFAVLREQAPVHWQERVPGRGFWSITRYDDVQTTYNRSIAIRSASAPNRACNSTSATPRPNAPASAR
jgi:cytochrome P450